MQTASTGRAGGVRLSADIGGTFTDIAAYDRSSGALLFGKTLSTPDRLVDGIAEGVGKTGLELAEAALFLHGSTIAINTMLERTGARTALLTTEGFRDIYEIGRINRPDSFNLYFRKHRPLIERALRFEVRERLYADGHVLTELDMGQVEQIADELEAQKIEAVAILFLHSYRNPAHEERVKAYLERRFPAMFVTASHELSNEYREFERTSTVAANAYVGPRVRRYLAGIEGYLEQVAFSGSLLIVQSTGGLYTVAQAKDQCVRMMESGPAAGVIGAQALCRELGIAHAIAFDMGGTTAKAGVIQDGHALTTGGAMVGGYFEGLPLQIAMLDINEVGTGGGSIARVGRGNRLRVGPESAGARPGPVCYGRSGKEPTVTDAHLLLGRLEPERFLGGELRLDVAATERAMRERVAGPLGLDVTEAADGILRIATTSMCNAVKAVTTERGLDLGEFGVLIAYGGAGPLHAAEMAAELGIPQVLIPVGPGHFSALGMLLADLRYDDVRSLFARLADVMIEELERLFGEMETAGFAAVQNASVAPEAVLVSRAMDMRYVGQEHAVTVALPADRRDRVGIKEAFDRTHELRYGYAQPDQAAEIVSLRLSVVGTLPQPPLASIPQGGPEPAENARRPSRPIWARELRGFVECAVFDRERLCGGNRVEGPALVEEHASTTFVPPGGHLTVDARGNLVISIRGR